MDTKTPLHSQYKDSFFRHRDKLLWRVPIVCNAINKVLQPTSVIDVGCANGDIIKGFSNIGINTFGVEGSPHAKPHLVCDPRVVFFKDLREDIDFNMRFDLCTCLEVAEHIERKYVPNFVANIVSLSDQLLLSIAQPGQGGLHHYTLEDIRWWDNYFCSYGYIRDDSIATKITKQWTEYKDKPGILAYYYNLHFYRKFCEPGAIGP